MKQYLLGMELRHLKYFLAVAEELNFTRAAEKLCISQPPLSRQIKELEVKIGAQLFERSNKKVRLTSAGVYFKKEITEQLQLLDTIILQTKKIADNVSGVYRIGYISSTFSMVIAQLLQFLSQKYPYVNIKLYEVSTSKQIIALEQGKLDLGIVRAPLISTKIKTKTWFKDGYCLVYNNQYLKTKNILSLGDVADEVFVFFNKEYAPVYYSSLVEICSYHGFYPNVVHESNNINSIIQLVLNGLGVSIVPKSLKNTYQRSELSFLEIDSRFSTDVLVASPQNKITKITDVAIDFLLNLESSF